MHAAGLRRALLVLVCVTLLVAGCTSQPPPPPAGSDTNGHPAPDVPAADPRELMAIVDVQVHDASGEPVYRVPGTRGHDETIRVLKDMLAGRSLEVSEQTFETELPRLGRVALTNLYGVRPGADAREVWLAAHWDSRAWADGDPDPDNHDEPVMGANDGAAAVAVVVHALDLLPPTNLTVRVALFDGEDQGDGSGGWAVGSKHAAQTLSREDVERIAVLILVDMPGDPELEIRREGASQHCCSELLDLVFATARDLDASSFIDEPGPFIEDDHVGFVQRGVPAVDLIHLDDDDRRGPFPWTHHTVHDTPENLDPERIAEVTNVVVATVLRIDRGGLASA